MRRLDIFMLSMERVDMNNQINGAEVFGVTKFSDRTIEEFSVRLGGKFDGVMPAYLTTKLSEEFQNSNAPTYVNWADEGIVTPVKNQVHAVLCVYFLL